MATEINSQKIFGGSSLPAGTYNIHSAFCDKDAMMINNVVQKYDTIEVRVFNDAGEVLRSTLRLNGCWRARKGVDGKPYQASGTFFEAIIKKCAGKTFAETRDYINANLTGFQLVLSYERYPSTTGFGSVPICNISSERKQVPALPENWQPIRSELALKAKAEQPAAVQPATQPAGNDLPF